MIRTKKSIFFIIIAFFLSLFFFLEERQTKLTFRNNTISSGQMLESNKNNSKCVDLSDIKVNIPLTVSETKRILWQTETWEYSAITSRKNHDSLGYPSVVRNIYGFKPDYKYYLYYAHHDPHSGIGCAVSEVIGGPYKKLAEVDKHRKDSQVLKSFGNHQQAYHFSSPCVVWNEDEKLWFMYFHYFKNEWAKGRGHQKTALATCQDLAKNVWIPWTDKEDNLIDVLPVTKERWMNSQSSYHAIQKLPDGTWLAFLRGTGGEVKKKISRKHKGGKREFVPDTCKLGFAKSKDGRYWYYFPENPVIHQLDGGNGKNGVYRPGFIGYLGNKQFLLCWAESEYYDKNRRIIYGKTTNFLSFQRDPRGYAKWISGDGLISPWREENRLYLFTGSYVHIMELSIAVVK
ncbi:glycosyl hydrolase domain-containing protein [Desulfonema limicola]|uniref:Glycosyl hydrolase domain-containing protein n=1 Tax=Desulfonema limicola TaxID=45656 RepID=A0A975BCP8_9BACT|nr:hypothetical protein [Desulfonema limicola]QTA83254.1 glycosyl hydrolase domain-containing protein [Desulfonema limicola]